MAYYYSRAGQKFGPHTEVDMQSFVASGALQSSDLVWRDGMSAWAPLHTVFPNVPPPPPVPLGPPPGYPAAAAGYPASLGKSRVAFVLLGLFLGGLGIHNFYAGYTGRAVAQLLITLFLFWLIFPLIIVGIWALIEVIVVTRDASGTPFT
jgi:TM2 domain-containing membrane protein YozV